MKYESDEGNRWDAIGKIVHPEFGDITEEVAAELAAMGPAGFSDNGAEKIRMAEVEARELAVAAKFLGLDKAMDRHRGVRRLARIPPRVYHYWGQRLGYDCWDAPDFRDGYMLRHFEELRGPDWVRK